MASSTIARLVVELSMNAAKFTKEMQSAERRGRKFGRGFERAGRSLTRGLSLPLLLVGGASIKMAADAIEAENLFTVAMGGMAASGREFSETMSDALELNRFEVRKTLGIFQQMFTAMTFGAETAFEMARGMTQLTADMASFFNLAPEEAFAKLQSGISGMIKPLRELGVLVDDNTVKMAANRFGIKAQGGELSQLQKVLLRYILIIEQTSNAQGDLARTMESPANVMRRFITAIQETAIAIGKALVPMFITVTKAAFGVVRSIGDLARWFRTLPGFVQTFAISIVVLAAAFGPLLLAMGVLITAMPLMNALMKTGAAAIASPLGLVLLLAGALVLLHQNWAETSAFWVLQWEKMKRVSAVAISSILGFVSDLVVGFTEMMTPLALAVGVLTGTLPLVGNALAAVEAFKKKIAGARVGLDAFAVAQVAVIENATETWLNVNEGTDSVIDSFEQWRLKIEQILAALRAMDTTTADTLAKVALDTAKALRVLDERAGLLGTGTLPVLEAKMGVVHSAITKLLEEGFKPGSAAIQRYTQEWLRLKGAFDAGTAAAAASNETLQFIRQTMEAMRTPLDELIVGQARLALGWATGLISLQEFAEGLAFLKKQFDEIKNLNLGQALQTEIVGALSAISAAMGKLLANLSGGTRDFLKAIIGVVGTILQNLGRTLIAFGIAGIAIKKFITNPAAAIVAGAALVALGSALAASAAATVNAGGESLAGGGGVAAPTQAALPTHGGGATLIIELRGGERIDFGDPHNAQALIDGFEDILGRRVIIRLPTGEVFDPAFTS